MNKPDKISKPDWDILITKYDENYLKEMLKKDYPYQYLIGNVDFYNSNILVNSDVLIPRWETEELVNRIVTKLNGYKFIPKSILDICTGSGCIAISLAKKYNIAVTAIDNSNKALDVAQKNAKRNNVNLNLILKDVLQEKITGKYDLIVSNPPYVSISSEIDNESKYQPYNAIYAQDDGFLFYSVLLKEIKINLNEKYFIAMEIGAPLKDRIEKLAEEIFKNASVWIEKDLDNRYRYLFITNIE